LRDITLAETIYVFFTTRAFATGIPTVLAGSPVVSAYENNSATQITAGITLGVSHDSVAGLNLLTIVATGANGFEASKDYTLVITTGTVDSVSVVGEVVGEFTIGRSAAATDLANGTDGLGAIKTETALIVADTAELQGDWANAGRLDAILDIVAADTTTEIPALIATAQADLDIITGASGVNLLTATQASIDAIETDTATTLQGELDAIQAAVITNATGADIAADIIALKAETALIVADTNELQVDDTPAAIAALNDPTAAAIADAVWDELQAEHLITDSFGVIASEIATIDGIVDTVLADTNELQVDDIPTLIAALNNLSAANVNAEVVDVMRTDLIPDAVNTPGTMPTIAQALYIIMQALTDHTVISVTDTIRKIDGAATLATLTLNDETSPTAVSRTT
jgi:hypothetical protein